MKLLHGTTMKRLEKIRQQGLRSAYLTDLESVAVIFAEHAAYDERDVPVVLEVTVRDPDQLRADLEMYRAPITPVLEALDVSGEGMYYQLRKDGDLFQDPDPRDWRTSLHEMHSVRHRGRILPRDVKVYV